MKCAITIIVIAVLKRLQHLNAASFSFPTGCKSNTIIQNWRYCRNLKNRSIMFYVVKIKEYKTLKTDVILIEETDTVEKAKALRDAMRAIYPDEMYEVLTAVKQPKVLSMTLNCFLFFCSTKQYQVQSILYPGLRTGSKSNTATQNWRETEALRHRRVN